MEERSLLWPIFSPQYTCTFVFFIVHCTPFRLAQAPALPSFTHLRLNPDLGRPPALSKPLNKCGTVRALLFHEYRASWSVCPILAWFCTPAKREMVMMLSGMIGTLSPEDFPWQHYMPTGRVDRAQDEQEFCLLCFHIVLCNFFILMVWFSLVGIL